MSASSRSSRSTPKGKDFWGKRYWCMIHILSITNITPSNFRKLLEILTRNLPCDYCRRNLTTKLTENSPEFTENDLWGYSFLLHDKVNKHLSELYPSSPKTSPSKEYLLRLYKRMLSSKEYIQIFFDVMFIGACTMKSENSLDFAILVNYIIMNFPVVDAFTTNLKNVMIEVYNDIPIKLYLRSNHDAFFYVYTLYNLTNTRMRIKSIDFDKLKKEFFRSLGEDCSTCRE